jgi:pyruvate/2-oxoacid:ferredoxin oxidoreductase alpha subunit
MPRVIGGRYGLSSKDFTPAMAKAAFDELKADETADQLHPRDQRRCEPPASPSTKAS